MRHTNNVYMSGRITYARAYDGQRYGFLNLTVGDRHVPVAVKFSGPKYNGQRVMAMEAQVKSNAEMYAIVGGGHVQEKKNGGWEVSINDSDFMLYTYPVPEVTFVQLRGKILTISPDQANVHWAEIAQSYWSKNPKDDKDKGQWKERKIRVRLDAQWQQNIVGQKMGITGTLHGRIGEQKILHVVSGLSYIFE